ncbi:MAG: hypothetical protein ACTHXF_08960 [Brevibacterium yomogidense]
MPRTLADGKTKFTILTARPEDPAAPTATELNAGIDLSCDILSSDFTWGATDSDKVAEKALCDVGNANAIGASNFQAGVTLWRYFAPEGGFDETEDAGFEALKRKGTTVWGYARKTDKLSTEDWEAADEIYLGAEVSTDEPQPPSDQGGYIKWRVPMEPQRGYPFTEVAAGV